MKAIIFSCAYFASAALGAALTTACNADNCARGVTGTRSGKTPGVTSRQADCSSFMLTTVTPDTYTTTVATVTIYTPAPAKRDVEARMVAGRDVTVIPTNVPTYASACSGTARYSSACSCWGITATVSTAPTPTASVTATVYVTSDCNSPHDCANYYPNGLYDCSGQGDGEPCACGLDADGTYQCFQHDGCIPCQTDADCSNDNSQVCIVDTCCGQPACFLRANVCPNGASKRAIFGIVDGVKKARDVVCNTPSCSN